MWAPRCLRSAAMVSKVSEAAFFGMLLPAHAAASLTAASVYLLAKDSGPFLDGVRRALRQGSAQAVSWAYMFLDRLWKRTTWTSLAELDAAARELLMLSLTELNNMNRTASAMTERASDTENWPALAERVAVDLVRRHHSAEAEASASASSSASASLSASASRGSASAQLAPHFHTYLVTLTMYDGSRAFHMTRVGMYTDQMLAGGAWEGGQAVAGGAVHAG